MAQTLDNLIREVEAGKQHLTYEGLKGRDTRETERLVDSFASVLPRMTPAERISASRHGGFTRWSAGCGRPATPRRCRSSTASLSGSPATWPTSTDSAAPAHDPRMVESLDQIARSKCGQYGRAIRQSGCDALGEANPRLPQQACLPRAL
jgi:hypothetical protein